MMTLKESIQEYAGLDEGFQDDIRIGLGKGKTFAKKGLEKAQSVPAKLKGGFKEGRKGAETDTLGGGSITAKLGAAAGRTSKKVESGALGALDTGKRVAGKTLSKIKGKFKSSADTDDEDWEDEDEEKEDKKSKKEEKAKKKDKEDDEDDFAASVKTKKKFFSKDTDNEESEEDDFEDEEKEDKKKKKKEDEETDEDMEESVNNRRNYFRY